MGQIKIGLDVLFPDTLYCEFVDCSTSIYREFNMPIDCSMVNSKYQYTCSGNRTEERWAHTLLTDYTTYVSSNVRFNFTAHDLS